MGVGVKEGRERKMMDGVGKYTLEGGMSRKVSHPTERPVAVAEDRTPSDPVLPGVVGQDRR